MDNTIKFGLDLLTINDNYLLVNDVNERSITHKMGEYYAILFPGWDVDCEFNKNLKGPKNIDIDPESFLHQMADFLDTQSLSKNITVDYSILRDADIGIDDVNSLKEQLRNPDNLIYDDELDLIAFVLKTTKGKKITKPIFPDIIVHKRGKAENLIVIEAKKSSNNDRASRLYDLIKLHILVTDPKYKYKHGYFIDIPTNKPLIYPVEFISRSYRFNKNIKIVESKK